MKTNLHFWSYLAQFFIEWEMFQTNNNNNNNNNNKRKSKHIFYPVNFFFEKRAVYETMWKYTVEPDRPQMTIRRMRIVYWITKSIGTLSQHVILITFPLQQCYANAPLYCIVRTLPAL